MFCKTNGANLQGAPQPGVTERLEGGGSSCTRIDSRVWRISRAMHHHQSRKAPHSLTLGSSAPPGRRLLLGRREERLPSPSPLLEVPAQGGQCPLLGSPNSTTGVQCGVRCVVWCGSHRIPSSRTQVTPGSIRLEGSLVLSQRQITHWLQK